MGADRQRDSAIPRVVAMSDDWGDNPGKPENHGGIVNPWAFYSVMSGFGLIILGLVIAMVVQWPVTTLLLFVVFPAVCIGLGRLVMWWTER